MYCMTLGAIPRLHIKIRYFRILFDAVILTVATNLCPTIRNANGSDRLEPVTSVHSYHINDFTAGYGNIIVLLRALAASPPVTALKNVSW